MLTIRRIDKDDVIIIRLSGHAGSTADGINVCNMASTIFAMFYNAINSCAGGCAVRGVQGSDWLYFDRDSEGLALAYAASMGFDMLAERFPGNVSFSSESHVTGKYYNWDRNYTRRERTDAEKNTEGKKGGSGRKGACG